MILYYLIKYLVSILLLKFSFNLGIWTENCLVSKTFLPIFKIPPLTWIKPIIIINFNKICDHLQILVQYYKEKKKRNVRNTAMSVNCPTGIYLFKVNKRNTRTIAKKSIQSKECWCRWYHSCCVFIVDKFHTLLCCFHCCRCQLGDHCGISLLSFMLTLHIFTTFMFPNRNLLAQSHQWKHQKNVWNQSTVNNGDVNDVVLVFLMSLWHLWVSTDIILEP